MYRAMDGFTVRTTPLPGGDQGILKTLGAMRGLVDAASRQLDVREAAVRAIRLEAVGDHDMIGQVRALFHYVRDSIVFVNDPAGTEWVQSPRYTIASGAGDCDDRAVLLAALLRSIGVPCDFKVVAVDPRRPQTMSHVYVVARLGAIQIPLDPTYGDNRMGFEPRRPFRTASVPA
jgi:transglutaminase-like putative cysteine protease